MNRLIRSAMGWCVLLRLRAQAGNGSGKRPLGGEDAVKIGHGGRGMAARRGIPRNQVGDGNKREANSTETAIGRFSAIPDVDAQQL